MLQPIQKAEHKMRECLTLLQMQKAKRLFLVIGLLSLLSMALLFGFGFHRETGNFRLQFDQLITTKPHLRLPEFLLSKLQDKSLGVVDEKQVSATQLDGNGKKRSQEYCNVLEHSVYDKGNTPPSYELSAVAVVMRHGDRAPIYNFPSLKPPKTLSCNLAAAINSSSQKASLLSLLRSFTSVQDKKLSADELTTYFKMLFQNPDQKSNLCYVGQLTSRGFQQMIEIGQALRKIYVDRNFGSAGLNLSSEIYVRSTQYMRAFYSAVGFLHGFLQGNDTKVRFEFDSDIYFCDQSFGRFSCNCPYASVLQSLNQKHKSIVNRTLHRQMKEKIAKVFDVSVGQVPWIGAGLEMVMTHVCHGQNLLCSAKTRSGENCVTWPLVEELWRLMDESGKDHQMKPATEKHSRLLSYPLLHEIVQRFLGVTLYSTHKNATRFHLFSGHDKTLMVLINSLGIFNERWPPFASHLVFELYGRRKKQYYIRILFNGKDVTSQVKFCQGVQNIQTHLCPFDNFVYFVLYDTYQYFKAKNYDDMCNLHV